MKIFVANKVNKIIDGKTILDDITLTIAQGEKIAITGPNGSGKSSLLKLIAGIYEESTGQVVRTKIQTGYVPEHFPETIRFKLQEYLVLMGQISGKSEETILKEVTNYAKHFVISDYLNTPLKNCSKGTKQKVGIIQSLLKDPDLLLMDEPLTGLDDEAQKELVRQLFSLQSEKTILFTAHESLLIEEIADRVIRVESGKIVSNSLKNKKEKVRLIRAILPKKVILSEIPCLSYEPKEGNAFAFTVSANQSDMVLLMLLKRGCSILELIEKG